MAEFKNFEDMISAALNRAEGMPDEDAQKFLRAVFEQKVAPSQWFQQRFPDPGTQYEVAQKLFGVEQPDANKMPKAGVPGLQTWEPKGALETAFDKSSSTLGRQLGGGLGGWAGSLINEDSRKAGEKVGRYAGAGADIANMLFQYLPQLAGVYGDKLLYDVLGFRGGQRPLEGPGVVSGSPFTGGLRKESWTPSQQAGGGELASMLPRTPGESVAAGLLMSPGKLYGALKKFPALLSRFESTLAANKAAAAAENARWAAGNIKGALPPVGGTTSQPIPMPPSSLTPPPPIAGGSEPLRIPLGPFGGWKTQR